MSRFWQHFISDGRGSQACPRLGLHGHAVPLFSTVICRDRLTQTSGVEVWRIDPGSLAEKAGLLEDDILLAVASQPISSMDQLGNVVRQLRGQVEVVLLRGEVQLERWLRFM